MQTLHLAKIIHETHSNVDYCWLLLKQAQTLPAVVPDRKQTTAMQTICYNAMQYVWMETLPAGSMYSRLPDAHYTAVNGSVFTECTADRQCFVWERRTVIVTGNVNSTLGVAVSTDVFMKG